jgi:MFS family permease
MLHLVASPWGAFAYLALVGMSQGIASPMMTALWSEVYGVESLGATKSTVAMFGIFGTAVGPLLLGWLLKLGVSFSAILPACALLGFAAAVSSFAVRRHLQRA